MVLNVFVCYTVYNVNLVLSFFFKLFGFLFGKSCRGSKKSALHCSRKALKLNIHLLRKACRGNFGKSRKIILITPSRKIKRRFEMYSLQLEAQGLMRSWRQNNLSPIKVC